MLDAVICADSDAGNFFGFGVDLAVVAVGPRVGRRRAVQDAARRTSRARAALLQAVLSER